MSMPRSGAKAAIVSLINSGRISGISPSKMMAASTPVSRDSIPLRMEEAIPVCQSGFFTMRKGSVSNAAKRASASAPRTTTISLAVLAHATSATRRRSGLPSICSNNLSRPRIRLDAPAARRTIATRYVIDRSCKNELLASLCITHAVRFMLTAVAFDLSSRSKVDQTLLNNLSER